MKRVCFTVVCGLILAALAYSQSPRLRKPIEVTQRMISSRTDKPYVIDLTQKRNTYVVAAGFASRVRIRMSKGEMVMTDLLRKLKVPGNKFVVGTLADFLPPDFVGSRTAPRATAFKCDGNVCTCNPIAPYDCWQMGFDCETSMICVNPCDGPECSPEEANRLLYCWCEQLAPD